MGTFTWIETLASQRGWGYAAVAGNADCVVVSGRSSVSEWQCVLDGRRNSEGNHLGSVLWTALLVAVAADGEFEVREPVGAFDLGAVTATESAMDAAVAGLNVVRGLLKRSRIGPQPLRDIAEHLKITDPAGVMTDELLSRYTHWPLIANNPFANALRKADAAIATKPVRPPDAPPSNLVARVTGHHMLSVSTAAWWNRPAWLTHQVDLGIAIAEALVSAGFVRSTNP
jgi:hypothetical protein